MSQLESNRLEEIDLREMLLIFVKRKYVILASIIVAVAIGFLYCFITTPVFRGEAILELGEIIADEGTTTKRAVVRPIEEAIEIQEIIFKTFGEKANKDSVLKVDAPRGGQRLLRVRMESSSREDLKASIQKIVDFILVRHKEKYDFYSKSHLNINPTKAIGEIEVKEDPIRPNLKSIVSGMAFAGFLMGLFLVFVIEFVVPRKD